MYSSPLTSGQISSLAKLARSSVARYVEVLRKDLKHKPDTELYRVEVALLTTSPAARALFADMWRQAVDLALPQGGSSAVEGSE